jgi:hypothetical protein
MIRNKKRFNITGSAQQCRAQVNNIIQNKSTYAFKKIYMKKEMKFYIWQIYFLMSMARP